MALNLRICDDVKDYFANFYMYFFSDYHYPHYSVDLHSAESGIKKL